MFAVQEGIIGKTSDGSTVHQGSGVHGSLTSSPINVWACSEGTFLLTVIEISNTMWATPIPFDDPSMADKFSKVFSYVSCFEKLKTCISDLGRTPCEAYQYLYGTPENMKGYLDGQPRPPERARKVFERDFFRYAPSLKEDDDKKPTFWSGLMGIGLEEGSLPIFLGRIANGAGDGVGYSESGMFLAHEVRGKGFGKLAFAALLVHALVGQLKNFPVAGQPLKHFSATISSENPKFQNISILIERINAAAGIALIKEETIQRDYGFRKFVSVDANDIEFVARVLLPDLDTQLKVNGIPFRDFKGGQATTEPLDEPPTCASVGFRSSCRSG